RRGRLLVGGVDEQAAVAAGQRRVGGVAPPRELDIETQVAADAVRQQAHEVGVAREPCLDPREHLGGDRGTAEHAAALEQRHAAPRPREVGGCHEGVVAAADDDDVTHVAHAATLLSRWRRSAAPYGYASRSLRRQHRWLRDAYRYAMRSSATYSQHDPGTVHLGGGGVEPRREPLGENGRRGAV